MSNLSLILLAVLPVIVLLYFIYKKDIDKEPRGTLIKIIVWEVFAIIPICMIEMPLSDLFPSQYIPSLFITFVTVFVSVAIVEEFFKWIVVYKWTYRRLEFNHVYDGIVYGVFSSLSFAAVENILYLIQYGASGFWEVFIARSLMSIPSHATDGVFMGVLFSLSKQALVKKDNKKALLYLIYSILIPSITHTIYDGLIFYATSYDRLDMYIMFGLFVLLTYIVSFVLIIKFSKVPTNFDGTLVNNGKDNANNEKQVV